MKFKSICIIALGAVVCVVLSGCIPALEGRRNASGRAVSYPDDLKTGSMKSEIARLEKIADGKYSNEQKADACLRLALMLSHYTNNSPDYSRASTRLAQFEALKPELARESEIRHFNSLLKALTDKDSAITKQSAEMQRMGKMTRELETEIKRLEDIIEKLNQLDMQLEQKRRGSK